MEAFAAIQTISSIVQLVDFGSKCVAKGVELYRSIDGVLDENAAIEIAATHLTTLNDKVRNAVFSTADQQLRDLCSEVAEASSELLSVLERLKVQGTKTKWKSMRKAIKSVWGKDKVKELEGKLASFRDELNLHICVRTRQQLESLQIQVASRFDNCDARTKEILDAIVNDRNVFQSNLSDHTVLICDLHEKTRRYIQQNHETTRLELRQVATHVELANQDEHAKTRQEIQQEGDRVIASNRDSNREVAHTVELVEVNLQETIELSAEANTIQHEQTQSQIAELEEALRQLSEQMESRDRELRDLLTALNKSTSDKKRKLLRERSNAVTAAILALKTMYRSLREILESLQSSFGELIQKARSSELWQVTRYTHKSTSSRDSGIEIRSLGYSDTGTNDDHGQSNRVQNTTYIAHRLYFGYYYQWLDKHSILVCPGAMEKRWYFRKERLDTSDMLYANYEGISVDDSYCDSKTLWLLAAVNAAIIRNVTPDTASFNLISKVFDEAGKGPYNDGNIYSSGSLSSRLRADMEYWKSFAKTRGMLDDSMSPPNSTNDLITLQDEHESNVELEFPAEPKFNWEQLTPKELRDLDNLLHWLIGSPNVSSWSQNTSTVRLGPEGPASYVAKGLGSMGLRMFAKSNLHPLELDSSPEVVVRYSQTC